MNLLDICKKYGMSNPTDIRHWYEDIQNYIDEEKKEFAKLKCAEQRQICANNARLHHLNEGNKLRDCILNAPEPEV